VPELPEVESIARAMRTGLVGRRLTGLRVRHAGCFVPSPRAFRRAALGRVLTDVHRHGKYLLLTFTGDDGARGCVMLHLRMTGQFFFREDYVPDRHVHAVLDFAGRPLFYRDVRKFGRWTVVQECRQPREMAHIGPDMLEVRFTQWRERVRRRRAPWKAVLLDQTVAAGIGNIYADEALHRAGLHPLLTPAETADADLRRLFDAVKGVLHLAIRHGGTTFLDFVDFHGRPGNFRRRLRVFQRQGGPCRRCGETIERIRVAGRSTHFCPRCQRR